VQDEIFAPRASAFHPFHPCPLGKTDPLSPATLWLGLAILHWGFRPDMACHPGTMLKLAKMIRRVPGMVGFNAPSSCQGYPKPMNVQNSSHPCSIQNINLCIHTTVDLEIIYGSVINYIWYIGESVLIYLRIYTYLWNCGIPDPSCKFHHQFPDRPLVWIPKKALASSSLLDLFVLAGKVGKKNGKTGILGHFMLVCCLLWFLCCCSMFLLYLWCLCGTVGFLGQISP